MAEQKRGLGKGLQNLGLHELLAGMGEPVALAERTPLDPNQGGLQHVPINRLAPGRYQPRTRVDDARLLELAQSIRTHGVVQPVLVRRLATEGYEIIAGERRWRAAKLANLQTLPVIIQVMTDEMAAAVALIENIQREDLGVVDEAKGLKRLMEQFGLSHQALAQVIGKSRASVSNTLRVLEATPVVLAALEEGQLSMGHARALLGLSAEQQARATQEIARRDLSVRATEQWVKRVGSTQDGLPELPSYTEQTEALALKFKTQVKIKSSAAGVGQIQIKFCSSAQLDALIEMLKT